MLTCKRKKTPAVSSGKGKSDTADPPASESLAVPEQGSDGTTSSKSTTSVQPPTTKTMSNATNRSAPLLQSLKPSNPSLVQNKRPTVHKKSASQKTNGGGNKSNTMDDFPPVPSLPPPMDNTAILSNRGGVFSCCWSHLSECIFPFLPTIKCQRSGCDNQVHHGCQIQWKTDNNVPEGPITTLCPWHDEEASKVTATRTGATAQLPAQRQPNPRNDSSSAQQLISTNSNSRRRNKCDWGNHISCTLSAVRAQPCAGARCNKLVHLPCQELWEQENVGVLDDDDKEGEYSAKVLYCFEHHPAVSNMQAIDNMLIDAEFYDASEFQLGDDDASRSSVRDAKNDDDSDSNEDNDEDANDLAEVGNMSNSDEEGEQIDDHNNYLQEVREERAEHCNDTPLLDDYYGGEEFEHGIYDDESDSENSDIGSVVNKHWLPRGGKPIEGAPIGWIPPSPPEDFRYVADKKAPTIENIDNPGRWNLWSFAPRFNKKREYIGHFTPGGAQVVPERNGSRSINGWEFHYQGWRPDNFDSKTFVRGDAKKGNLKPTSRRGVLDCATLKKHGMTAERMNDPMFFFQLLFPICDPKESGIDNDNRVPYFTHVTMCTNGYSGFDGGGSDSYGHAFNRVTEAEMVRWTAVPIRHGAFDGRAGTIHTRWDASDQRYDQFIDGSITKSRWLSIKRYFKLNNNTMEVTDKASASYNPCNKYDHIYKCLVHNINYLTLTADMDCTVDETTWGFGGFSGECGQRLINKPVSKGGQVVMLFDINRRYPRAYEHRHNYEPKVPPFTAKGPAEICRLVSMIDSKIIGADATNIQYRHPSGNKRKDRNLQVKQIYPTQPHICADNFFSSDTLLDYLGNKGYGMTVTVRRDRYPEGFNGYVHSEKGLGQDKRARVMRFEWPIVAIKQCVAVNAPGTTQKKKSYTKTFVSFMSTGSTNIAGVNNLPGVSLYVKAKERGIADEKRHWGNEQNEARETYLNHYNAVDQADHMIKNAACKYITWKYWHAPYLHALSLGLVVAYDIYKDCAEGYLDKEWRVPKKKRMNFQMFRARLSEQMLMYNPQTRRYPGDEKFRSSTKQTKAQRSSLDSEQSRQSEINNDTNDNGATKRNKRSRKQENKQFHEMYVLASTGYAPRCCNSATDLQLHIADMERKTKALPCEVCGCKTTWKCGRCNRYMCTTKQRKWTGLECTMKYHSHEFFGLSRTDSRMVYRQPLHTWKAPDDNMLRRNANAINRLRNEMMLEDENRNGNGNGNSDNDVGAEDNVDQVMGENEGDRNTLSIFQQINLFPLLYKGIRTINVLS